jgi:hypothetical protein
MIISKIKNIKNILLFICFLNPTVLLSQIKIVCEYNSEWSYDWYHNNVFLNINTNVLYSIGSNVSGNYQVVITNKCDTTYQRIHIKNPKDKNTYHLKKIYIDSCRQILFDDVWYNELESDLSFIIFPNPAKNLLNFRIYRGNSPIYQIKIYDSFGKKIIQKKVIGDSQIDITNLSKGIYIFEVTSNNSKKFQILIIN